MVKAEKILMEDQGVAPIYQRSQPWMVKPSVRRISSGNGAGVTITLKKPAFRATNLVDAEQFQT